MIQDQLIRIIEDHALTEEFIINVSRRLQEGKPMPDVPTLNSSIMMDALGNICEALAKR